MANHISHWPVTAVPSASAAAEPVIMARQRKRRKHGRQLVVLGVCACHPRPAWRSHARRRPGCGVSMADWCHAPGIDGP